MSSEHPKVLWHASRADVERPTVEGRTAGSNHANSGLGLFCATAPHDYIKGFGSHIHALTLKDGARVTTMTISDLSKMGYENDFDRRDRAWFETEGRRLAQDHDVVLLIESGGYPSQAIILRDDAVASSSHMTVEEFSKISTDVMANKRAYEKANPEPEEPRYRRGVFGQARSLPRTTPAMPMGRTERPSIPNKPTGREI